ncbi:hypothetical protein OROGR_025148 [Orobanche gracilis]
MLSSYMQKPPSTPPQNLLRVKAVVTVLHTVGGVLAHLGLSRRLDAVTDLLGRTLLVELIAAELDPESVQEKSTINFYAHKAGTDDNETYYEATFEIPEEFGEIGAVTIENEHRMEMSVKNIVFEGLSIDVSCNSWIHTESDNLEKRVFFTNK